MLVEFDTPVQTNDRYEKVFVDAYDDGVWLSLAIRAGSMHVTLSKEQAQEMIRRLTLIVEML